MIEAERLVLRRWQPSDVAPFAALCADAQVMRYIGDGGVRTDKGIADWTRRLDACIAETGLGLFAVERRDTGAFIGFTGLSTPDFLPEVLPATEIGWRLARDQWGHGFASEAATAALAYAKDRVTDPIVSICQVGNDASVRIMEKIGLSFDRRTTDPTCCRDVLVYRFPYVEM